LEQKLGGKYEYHGGQMFAMAGVSLPHGRIQVNLTRRVDEALSDSPCNVYPADVRVVIEAVDMATYPDLSIVCSPPCNVYPADVRVVIEAVDMATYPDLSIVCSPEQQAKAFGHSITNPTVLFEVLSPSTQAYDRGAKFDQYRNLASLREYVLVSQHAMAIDLYRLENSQWVFHPLRGEDAVLCLNSAGIQIPMREIYRGVRFEDAE